VTRNSRIDWFRVIVEIQRSGWSLDRIAFEMQRSKGSISNLKNIPGTEPRFHDGMKLLGLWCDVTGKQHTDAPTTELYPA